MQNVEHVMGKYIISDHPMTIEQWAAERATVVNEVIDDTPQELPAPKKDAEISAVLAEKREGVLLVTDD